MKQLEHNLREFIFGVEDGLIGNLGVVVGLATANAPNNLILLAGLATMFAQSISMSAGNYLSIKSEKEYFDTNKKDRAYGKKYAAQKNVASSTLVMGSSVFAGASIPVSSYLLWPSSQGIVPSIVLTLFTLFILGVYKSDLTKRLWYKCGGEMVIVGSIAATAGYIIGAILGV